MVIFVDKINDVNEFFSFFLLMHYSASFNGGCLQHYLNRGIGKLACLKVDSGEILGKLPWKSKIPFQGNGMAVIPDLVIGLTAPKTPLVF